MKDTSWRELYKAAMLELDPSCLPSRISEAQEAVQKAQRELGGQPSDRPGEMRALADAMENLRTLYRIELRVAAPPAGRERTAEGGSPA
ncbi:MAG: hypothetical protein ABR874_15580 [Candidatus Sulfotelmatobacter sp.]|jgi:hypothetical protein